MAGNFQNGDYNRYSDGGGGPGPIPKRWLKCPRKATKLLCDRFLAFKTPLDNKFNDQVPEDCRFPPRMLFSSMKSYKVRIGLWIDLTNTKRFYDQREVKNSYSDVDGRDVKYIKLECRGHGETPNPEQTRVFIELCRKYISTYPLDAIGVHCTHGFNRTGFLLVSFMVEEMDWSVGAAINEFAKCRAPGIYKQDYLEELFRRYDEIQFTPMAPERPSWCIEDNSGDEDDEDVINNGGNKHRNFDHSGVPGGGGGGGGGSNINKRKNFSSSSGESSSNNLNGEGNNRKRRKGGVKEPVFMDGVTNVIPLADVAKVRNIQRTAQNMCGWESTGFPGCQPVSMDLENMKLLQEKPYRVSWKADGTRYMMLILKEDEVYFIDRDNSVFQVKRMYFPSRKNPKRHLTNTLLDGEMVIDRSDGTDTPRYLVYDVIHCEGVNMSTNRFYPQRLTCIEIDIIQPRDNAIMKGLINKMTEPFRVRAKLFYPVEKAGSFLSERFTRQLLHEPDGLIFQPTINPYKAGQCREVLKWKPASHNSVDFRLKLVKESGIGIVPKQVGHLYVGNHSAPFAMIKVNSTLRELDNKIIECRFDGETQNWVYMRERTDKSFPNSFKTASAVCNSIVNPVSKECLLSFIERCRYRDDNFAVPMAPPPNRHHHNGPMAR